MMFSGGLAAKPKKEEKKEKKDNRDEKYDIQESVFLKWANTLLAGEPIAESKDLGGFQHINSVLQICTGQSTTFCGSRLDDAQSLLTAVGESKATAAELAEGGQKAVLAVWWGLIQLFWKRYGPEPIREEKLSEAIRNWCVEASRGYDEVSVSDFTSSWRDGYAFNILMHSFDHSLISLDHLSQMSASERLETAFDTAERHFRVTRLLERKDLQSEHLDNRSVVCYLMTLYLSIIGSTHMGTSAGSGRTQDSSNTGSSLQQVTSSSSSGQSHPPQQQQPSHRPLVHQQSIQMPEDRRSSLKSFTPEQIAQLAQQQQMQPQLQPVPESPIHRDAPQGLPHHPPPLSLATRQHSIQQSAQTLEPPASPIRQSATGADRGRARHQQSIEEPSGSEVRSRKSSSSSQRSGRSRRARKEELAREFESCLEQVLTWLLEAEDEITLLSEVDSQELDVVKAQFKEYEQFMSSLTDSQDTVGRVLHRGQMLCQKAESEEEKDAIQAQLLLVNSRWEELRNLAMARQSALQSQLTTLQQRQLGTICNWLTDTEGCIDSMPPLASSSDEALLQLQQHSALQARIDDYQPVINALAGFVAVVDDAEGSEEAVAALEHTLSTVGDRWRSICEWAERRTGQLDGLAELCEKTEEVSERLNEWLKQREHELLGLKSAHHLEDPDEVAEQVRKLQKSEASLESEHGQFVLLSQLSCELVARLDTANGAAANDIRRKLDTVTQRWDNLVSRIEEHSHTLVRSGKADLKQLKRYDRSVDDTSTMDEREEEEQGEEGPQEKRRRSSNTSTSTVQYTTVEQLHHIPPTQAPPTQDPPPPQQQQQQQPQSDSERTSSDGGMDKQEVIDRFLRHVAQMEQEMLPLQAWTDSFALSKKPDQVRRMISVCQEKLLEIKDQEARVNRLQLELEHIHMSQGLTSKQLKQANDAFESFARGWAKIVTKISDALNTLSGQSNTGDEAVVVKGIEEWIEGCQRVLGDLSRLPPTERGRRAEKLLEQHATQVRNLSFVEKDALKKAILKKGLELVKNKLESMRLTIDEVPEVSESSEIAPVVMQQQQQAPHEAHAEAPSPQATPIQEEVAAELDGEWSPVGDLAALDGDVKRAERLVNLSKTEGVAPEVLERAEARRAECGERRRLTATAEQKLKAAEETAKSFIKRLVDVSSSDADFPEVLAQLAQLRDQLVETAPIRKDAEKAVDKISNVDEKNTGALRDRLRDVAENWARVGEEIEDTASCIRKEQKRAVQKVLSAEERLLRDLENTLAASEKASDAEEYSEHLDHLENLLARVGSSDVDAASSGCEEGTVRESVARMAELRSRLSAQARERVAVLADAVRECERFEKSLVQVGQWAEKTNQVLAHRRLVDVSASDVPEEYKQAFANGKLAEELQAGFDRTAALIADLETFAAGEIQQKNERVQTQVEMAKSTLAGLQQQFAVFKQPVAFEARLERSAQRLAEAERVLEGCNAVPSSSLPEALLECRRTADQLRETMQDVQALDEGRDQLIKDGILDREASAPLHERIRQAKKKTKELGQRAESLIERLEDCEELVKRMGEGGVQIDSLLTSLDQRLDDYAKEESRETEGDKVDALLSELTRNEATLGEMEQMERMLRECGVQVAPALFADRRSRADELKQRVDGWRRAVQEMEQDEDALLLEVDEMHADLCERLDAVKDKDGEEIASTLRLLRGDRDRLSARARQLAARNPRMKEKEMTGQVSSRWSALESKLATGEQPPQLPQGAVDEGALESRVPLLSSRLSFAEKQLDFDAHPADSVAAYRDRVEAVAEWLKGERESLAAAVREGRRLAETGRMELETHKAIDELDAVDHRVDRLEQSIDQHRFALVPLLSDGKKLGKDVAQTEQIVREMSSLAALSDRDPLLASLSKRAAELHSKLPGRGPATRDRTLDALNAAVAEVEQRLAEQAEDLVEKMEVDGVEMDQEEKEQEEKEQEERSPDRLISISPDRTSTAPLAMEVHGTYTDVTTEDEGRDPMPVYERPISEHADDPPPPIRQDTQDTTVVDVEGQMSNTLKDEKAASVEEAPDSQHTTPPESIPGDSFEIYDKKVIEPGEPTPPPRDREQAPPPEDAPLTHTTPIEQEKPVQDTVPVQVEEKVAALTQFTPTQTEKKEAVPEPVEENAAAQATPVEAPATKDSAGETETTETPPTQVTPTEAPPTQSTPTEAPPTQATLTEAPPTQATLTEAPPSMSDDESPVITAAPATVMSGNDKAPSPLPFSPVVRSEAAVIMQPVLDDDMYNITVTNPEQQRSEDVERPVASSSAFDQSASFDRDHPAEHRAVRISPEEVAMEEASFTMQLPTTDSAHLVPPTDEQETPILAATPPRDEAPPTEVLASARMDQSIPPTIKISGDSIDLAGDGMDQIFANLDAIEDAIAYDEEFPLENIEGCGIRYQKMEDELTEASAVLAAHEMTLDMMQAEHTKKRITALSTDLTDLRQRGENSEKEWAEFEKCIADAERGVHKLQAAVDPDEWKGLDVEEKAEKQRVVEELVTRVDPLVCDAVRRLGLILPRLSESGRKASGVRDRVRALDSRFHELCVSVRDARALIDAAAVDVGDMQEGLKDMEQWCASCTHLLSSSLNSMDRSGLNAALNDVQKRLDELPSKRQTMASLEAAKEMLVSDASVDDRLKHDIRRGISEAAKKIANLRSDLSDRRAALSASRDACDSFWTDANDSLRLAEEVSRKSAAVEEAIIYTPSAELVAALKSDAVRLRDASRRIATAAARADEEEPPLEDDDRKMLEDIVVRCEEAAIRTESLPSVSPPPSEPGSTPLETPMQLSVVGPSESESMSTVIDAEEHASRKTESLYGVDETIEEHIEPEFNGRLSSSRASAATEDSDESRVRLNPRDEANMHTLTQLRHWLTETERDASGTVDLSDTQAAKDQVQHIQGIVEQLRQRQFDIVGVSDGCGSDAVRAKAAELAADTERVLAQCQRRKCQLNRLVEDGRVWEQIKINVEVWLAEGEEVLGDARRPEGNEATLKEELANVERLIGGMDVQRERIKEMNTRGNALLDAFPRDDAHSLSHLTSRLNMRWTKFNDNVRIRRAVLEASLRSRSDLHSALEAMESWMDKIGVSVQELEEASANRQAIKDAVRRRDWIEQQKNLRVELDAHTEVMASVQEMGAKLVAGLEPGKEKKSMESRLAALSDRWQLTKATDETVRTRLEEAEQEWEKLTHSLADLINWIENKSKELLDQQPIGGSLSAVLAQGSAAKQVEREMEGKSPAVRQVIESSHSYLMQHDLRPKMHRPGALDDDDDEQNQDPAALDRRRCGIRIHADCERLKERWAELGDQTQDWIKVVQAAAARLQELERSLAECQLHLSSVEAELEGARAVEKLRLEELKEARLVTEQLTARVDSLRVHVDDANDACGRILAADMPLDAHPRNQLEAVNQRFHQLKTTVRVRNAALKNAISDFGPSSEHFLAASVTVPWQRAVSKANQLPYYIDHNTEQTQWEHPVWVEMSKELTQFNRVKFIAYRTAMKLRALQKRLCLDLVSLPQLEKAFARLDGLSNEECLGLEGMVCSLLPLFEDLHARNPNLVRSVALAVDLCVNFLLNLYDPTRDGLLRVLSFKIALVVFSSAPLEDKYRYLFDLVAQEGQADQKHVALLLYDLIQMPRLVGEAAAFGGSNVEPSVRSCFEAVRLAPSIGVGPYLEWLKQEPQSVVWLPVMHRLSTAEFAKHQAKCNVCKMFPIVGLRYRCLSCFNFDMCQNCFFSQRTAKSHKLKHPMQEYSLPTTSGEDVRDFGRMVRNKLGRSKKDLGYLPLDVGEEGKPLTAPPAAARNPATEPMHQRVHACAQHLTQLGAEPERAEHPERRVEVKSPAQLISQVEQMQKDELDGLLQRLQLENMELKKQLEKRRQAVMSTPDLDRPRVVSPYGTRASEAPRGGSTLPRGTAEYAEIRSRCRGDGPGSPPSRRAADTLPARRAEKGKSVPSLHSTHSASDVMDEARALRLHKHRLEHRSRILEQQNEQLEQQLGRLKKMIEQQKDSSTARMAESWSVEREMTIPLHAATDAERDEEAETRANRMHSLLATVDDLGRAMESLVVSVVCDSEEEE